MSDIQLSDISYLEYRDRLKRKSQSIANPLTACLELTPRCNFNCKMCYVRLSESEANRIGKEYSAAEWIELGKSMAALGTLEVLLTGGEVFIRSDFKEIYDEYIELGFILHVFSNGYLIDDNIISWLSKKPPMNLRVSLYGASNETYEKVTGVKNAYDRVIRNVLKMKDAGIHLALHATLIHDNIRDLKLLEKFAEENDLHFTSSGGIVKSVRGAHSEAENARIKIADNEYLEDPVRGFFKVYDDPFAICGSKNCGFWITWDGKMTICSFIEKPYTNPFEDGFKSAWHELQQKLKTVKKPEKCKGCEYAVFCTACPGMFSAETGYIDQTNDYICGIAKSRYKRYYKIED